jgi:hypothetical protein
VPDNARGRKSGFCLIFGASAGENMGLEDDLKARTSALISQQMANWVVEIQRAIQGHQASLVRALDELGEQVARYDEKVDEQSIAASVSEVLAQQPSAAAADYSSLKASIAAVERGANLSEVLTHLVSEVAKQVDRTAMFIVKNNAAVGWYARGFVRNDAVKTLTVPLTADTLFRLVHGSRHATRGHISHSPGTAQALARLGGDAQGFLAVPLILRDKVAAILYCDTAQEEMPSAAADFVEILVTFAGKVIDVLSGAPRATGPVAVPGGTSPGLRPAAPAVPEATGPHTGVGTGSQGAVGAGTMRPQPATPFRPPTPPPARVPPSFTPGPAAAPRPAPTPPPRALSPEDQKAHDDAKRFARLVVSEIKLYNEAKVMEGRKTRDIYERLKEDIERGRQMYHDRVSQAVRDASDYFHDELVRILAGGEPSVLGPM